MNDSTNPEKISIADRMKVWLNKEVVNHQFKKDAMADELVHDLYELVKSGQSDQGEPVAWMTDKGRTIPNRTKAFDIEKGGTLGKAYSIPLYTTPQAPQRPSFDEITDLQVKCGVFDKGHKYANEIADMCHAPQSVRRLSQEEMEELALQDRFWKVDSMSNHAEFNWPKFAVAIQDECGIPKAGES